jgi:hypothetical protein
MKKLTLLALAFAALALVVSCGGSDDPSSKFVIDSNGIPLKTGLAATYTESGGVARKDLPPPLFQKFVPAVSLQRTTGDGGEPITTLVLLMTNGSPVVDEDGCLTEECEDCTLFAYALFFALGDEIPTGVLDTESDEYDVEYYFYIGAGYETDEAFYSYDLKSGTITLRGSFPKYTVKFNLDMYEYEYPNEARTIGAPATVVSLTGGFYKAFNEINIECVPL